MLHVIRRVDLRSDHELNLTYDDGATTTVDFTSIIERGGVFAPLANPDFFAKVELDESGRFISWPGDLDFCADALRVNQDVMATRWK